MLRRLEQGSRLAWIRDSLPWYWALALAGPTGYGVFRPEGSGATCTWAGCGSDLLAARLAHASYAAAGCSTALTVTPITIRSTTPVDCSFLLILCPLRPPLHGQFGTLGLLGLLG